MLRGSNWQNLVIGWETKERQEPMMPKFPTSVPGQLVSLTEMETEGTKAGTCLEDINSLGHDVFKEPMRHSSQNEQQAVGCMSQGSKGSRNFKPKERSLVSNIETSYKTRTKRYPTHMAVRTSLVY